MHLPWKQLIRFVADDGRIHYGQPDQHLTEDVGQLYHEWKPFSARILRGDGPFDPHAQLSAEAHPVRRLLSPLHPKDVKMIRALGANFAAKPGMPRSPIPILFYKPLATLAGPEDRILLPSVSAEAKPDYEVELVVVLGKEAKDVSIEEALGYVGAYTICNDVTSRQRCVDGGQWGLGKSHDGWLPIGPVLVNASTVDLSEAELKTEVNGKVCQKGKLSDMLWNIAETIAHLSAGTTLEKGSIICMGSPPPLQQERVWLRHGDDLKLTITGIGSLYNRIEGVNAARAKL